jgi:hypothetical protein
MRVHDLRHTCATLLLSKDPTTTLSAYAHFVPGMQRMAVSRLNERMTRPEGTLRGGIGLERLTDRVGSRPIHKVLDGFSRND